MITPEQAQKLLEGTTPAPWVLHPSKYVSGNYVSSAEGLTLVHATEPWAGPADAALIAAAPDLAMTVIELGEELERLRENL